MGRVHSKLDYIYALYTASNKLYDSENPHDPDELLELGKGLRAEDKLEAVIEHINQLEGKRLEYVGRNKEVIENKDVLLAINTKFLQLPEKDMAVVLDMTPSAISKRKAAAIDRYLRDPEFHKRVTTIIKSLEI